MRGFQIVTAITLVAIGLAGCLGPDSNNADTPAGKDEGVPPSQAIQYACPDGPSMTAPSGICVGRWADPLQATIDLRAAMHPANSAWMVLASTATQSAGVLNPASSGAAFQSQIHVSTDGGAMWEVYPLPAPSTTAGTSTPEARLELVQGVEVSAAGEIHVLGTHITVSDSALTRVPFHARSDDMGSTWSVVTELAPPGPWNALGLTMDEYGNLVATWQPSDGLPGVAWSADAGATWTRGEGDACRDAFDVSAPVTLAGIATILCDGSIIQVDMANAALVQTTEGGAPRGAIVAADSTSVWTTHRFVAAGSSDLPHTLQRSIDGGTSWSTYNVSEEVMSKLAGWDSPYVSALELDPWRNVHIVFRDYFPPTAPSVPDDIAGSYVPRLYWVEREERVLHAAMDNLGEARIVTRLTPEDPQLTPVNVAPHWEAGDDALAFQNEQGILAWFAEKGISFTRISPTGEAW